MRDFVKSLERGALKESPHNLNDKLLGKVKKQIDDQGSEPLPRTWAPLSLKTIRRKEDLSEYLDVPLRKSASTKWVMFGPLYDSIQELDSPDPIEMRVGVKRDFINPYIPYVYEWKYTKRGWKKTGKLLTNVPVGHYAHVVESRRPLFGVFWDFYTDWMVDSVLDALNWEAKLHVFAIADDAFYFK